MIQTKHLLIAIVFVVGYIFALCVFCQPQAVGNAVVMTAHSVRHSTVESGNIQAEGTGYAEDPSPALEPSGVDFQRTFGGLFFLLLSVILVGCMFI